jgi:drug/metabolite transporter (DMT)-like permease
MKLAIAGLLFNAAVWGMAWWPLRHLEALGLHPLFATCLIFALGALGIALWKPHAVRVVFTYRPMLLLMLVAGINNASFNWAVTFGDVVRVVLLFYLMPIWSAVFAKWLLHEPVGRSGLVRIGLALCGAFIVLWRPEVGLPWPASLAEWLAVLGGASFAANNVLLRRYSQVQGEVRSLAMFLGAMTCSGVAGAALAGTGSFLVGWPNFAPQAWPLWLGLAVVFGLVLVSSNLTLQYGAARLSAAITATVMLSEILFASGSSVLLGQAQLSTPTLVGGALIISATILAVRKGA